MDFSERVENILNEKKISKAKMLSDLKLGKNQFTYWKKNHTVPNGFSVQAIAEYLNVSVDYLIGRTENKNPAAGSNELFTEREKKFIIAYRNKPEMQPAVDKLLGIDAPSGINIAEDIAETVKKTQQAADIKCNSRSE